MKNAFKALTSAVVLGAVISLFPTAGSANPGCACCIKRAAAAQQAQPAVTAPASAEKKATTKASAKAKKATTQAKTKP